MIITISGKPGSGKSTIADILAKKLGMKRFSVGDFRREMAKKKGMTINELNKLGEKESFTDKDADEWQKNIGKTCDNFIIDGRLSYYFIPNSLKIFLDVSPKMGAKRIMKQKREEEKFPDLKTAVKYWHQRADSDRKRYKKYYNLDPYKFNNFDFILDASELSIEETADKISEFIEGYQKGDNFIP